MILAPVSPQGYQLIRILRAARDHDLSISVRTRGNTYECRIDYREEGGPGLGVGVGESFDQIGGRSRRSPGVIPGKFAGRALVPLLDPSPVLRVRGRAPLGLVGVRRPMNAPTQLPAFVGLIG